MENGSGRLVSLNHLQQFKRFLLDKVVGWDRYFMDIAQAVSVRSKDPKTKVGSVIACSDNRIVSTGYNGFEASADETFFKWSPTIKSKFVIHSEVNAILFAEELDIYLHRLDPTLYVTLCPCRDCASRIVNSGIRRVVMKEMRAEYKYFEAVHILLRANVKVHRIEEDGSCVEFL